MNKEHIKNFFDDIASNWDKEPICDKKTLQIILNNSGVTDGTNVLDVGCGTGVLFPYYLERNISSLTAVDLSAEMVKIAKSKCPTANIICGDAENIKFLQEFDVVMIYNAFPHFPNPEKLIENLSKSLKSGGKFSVAHGMSKAELDEIHKKSASEVSLPLPKAEDLAKIFERHFRVETIISNEKMYQVVGTKR